MTLFNVKCKLKQKRNKQLENENIKLSFNDFDLNNLNFMS